MDGRAFAEKDTTKEWRNEGKRKEKEGERRRAKCCNEGLMFEKRCMQI